MANEPGLAPRAQLTLVGAGHVFDIRSTVRGAVEALRPDVVFIELDQGRLQALLARDRGSPTPEAGGLVHRKMARFQQDVAAMYGSEVGSEMLGAVDGARAVGARLVLVDDDAGAALVRVRREMPLREKLRFVASLAGGALKGIGRRGKAKADIEGELARYQQDPGAVLQELGDKFPTIHRILIAERDELMAKRIRLGLAGARHGLAVLGDGHVGGIQRLLGDLEPKVYRLADVREGRLPRAWHATGSPLVLRFWHDSPVPPQV